MGCCPHLQTRAQRCPHIHEAEKLKEGGGHADHEGVHRFTLSQSLGCGLPTTITWQEEKLHTFNSNKNFLKM